MTEQLLNHDAHLQYIEYFRKRASLGLSALGNTPGQIRDNLVKFDCRGRRGSSQECPFAVYLKNDPLISWDMILVYEEYINLQWRDCDATIWLTRAQRDFIENFDDGFYEELVRL